MYFHSDGFTGSDSDCKILSLTNTFFILSSIFAKTGCTFSFPQRARPSCSQCVNISLLNMFYFCWMRKLLTRTLTDPARMDHTTLQSINTSMRNAWFCSAPRGCVQQHSSASLPSLSWFTGDVPALYCTETTLMNTTQACCTVNSCRINIAMHSVLMNYLCP